MTRSAAAGALALAAALLVALVAHSLLGGVPAPAPPATPASAPSAPAPSSRRRARPPVASARPVPAAPRVGPARRPPDDEEEPEEDEPGWRDYPASAVGPVVVGRVTQYAEPDPDCWVALEHAEDPSREDPSTLETFNNGKFRLTGFAPGRYRVRVKGDESVAVYSAAFEARDGAVTDAGVIRLRKPGCIAGVLLDRDGGEMDGSVRLFGRDPATLKRRVVEVSASVGRQGFQLAPHEAGEFSLAAEADEGWALLNAKTDADGLAWVEARLHPWASVEAVPAPDAGRPPGMRLAKITAEPVEVPDLGLPAQPVSVDGGGPAPRLLPGKWKVTVLGDRGSGLPAATLLESTVTLSEGQALRLEVR